MAEVAPKPVTVRIEARTGLARAFIRLVSIPALFGWIPSEETARRLAGIAGGLIRVRAVPV